MTSILNNEESTIYTSIIANKDFPREDIPVFSEYKKFVGNTMNAKIYKILSHKYVDGISIWVDGNIELLIPEQQLIDEWLGDADIALWKHHARDCVYVEAPAAAGLFPHKPEMKKEITEQIEHYKEKGFPEHAGMPECNVIIRRNTPRVNQFNEAWWAEICRWSQRDQLSFPYVIKDFKDLKVNYIEGDPRKHKYFKYTPHPLIAVQ